MSIMDEHTWTTQWNAKVKGLYRRGTIDWNSHQSILYHDEYCFKEMKGTIGIDIGAYIGSATLAMASKKMQVYAVEPLLDNVDTINKNIELNRYKKRVKVYQRAIGKNDEETLKAYYNTPNATENVHEFLGLVTDEVIEDRRYDEVKTISLNTLFEDNNLSHCDILKIDAEGGEWPCFEAASRKNLEKIHYITGEVHNGSLSSLMSLLQNQFNDVGVKVGLKKQPDECLQIFVLENKGW